MPKQKYEVEVDVPDGYVIHKQTAENEVLPLLPVIANVDKTLLCGLYLRRKEPVRESRWIALSNPASIGWQQRERARQLAGGNKLIRMDFEDGKLVGVELEEPQ